jgi:hypothetical protein
MQPELPHPGPAEPELKPASTQTQLAPNSHIDNDIRSMLNLRLNCMLIRTFSLRSAIIPDLLTLEKN